jgi:hypothetical protein
LANETAFKCRWFFFTESPGRGRNGSSSMATAPRQPDERYGFMGRGITISFGKDGGSISITASGKRSDGRSIKELS